MDAEWKQCHKEHTVADWTAESAARNRKGKQHATGNRTDDHVSGNETGRSPRVNMKGARVFAWTAFLLLDSIYLIDCIQRTAIPGAIFNNLQGDFLMTASQITRTSSIYTFLYGTGQILTGCAVDRFGGKKMGILGGFLVSCGLLLLCFSRDPGQLYLSRVLAAFGSCFMYVSVIKIAHILFPPKHFGVLVGLSSAVGFLGGVLGTMPIRLCISRTTGMTWFGWRFSFFILGSLTLLISVGSIYLLRILKERPKRATLITWRTVRALFNRKSRFCFITCNFWGYPVFFMMQAVIGQKFMQDHFNLTPDHAAFFTLTLSIGSIVFSLLGVPLVRLFHGQRRKVLLFCASSQIFTVLLMFAAVRYNLPIAFFYFAFFLLAISQADTSAKGYLTLELLDTRTIAFNEAIRNCFPFLGATFASYVCGRILDHFVADTGSSVTAFLSQGYLWILVFALVLSILHVIVLLGIPETNGKRYSPRRAN